MHYKYPSTPHFPFSPGVSRDDSILKSLSHFNGKNVITTLKEDGENTNMYRDHIHAKSLDSRNHPSRNWVKAFHASIAHLIPEGWRICGENLYARHSIEYSDLPSYFMGFSVWNEKNVALSWDDTLIVFNDLGIVPVPEVKELCGIFDEKAFRKFAEKFDTTKDEGMVMRLASSFAFEDFDKSIAKWVRKGHVQTEDHWMHQQLVPNGLTKKIKFGGTP